MSEGLCFILVITLVSWHWNSDVWNVTFDACRLVPGRCCYKPPALESSGGSNREWWSKEEADRYIHLQTCKLDDKCTEINYWETQTPLLFQFPEYRKHIKQGKPYKTVSKQTSSLRCFFLPRLASPYLSLTAWLISNAVNSYIGWWGSSHSNRFYSRIIAMVNRREGVRMSGAWEKGKLPNSRGGSLGVSSLI